MGRPGVAVERVGRPRGKTAEAFIRFPHRLYRECRQWVPWFDRSMRKLIARNHPFFEHSEADFFVARRGRAPVGRIALLHNRPLNEKHGESSANFYFFDAIDDEAVSSALFETAFEWARSRRLDRIVGPSLFGAASGHGILIDGFEHRASMTMMNYNYPYYRALIEKAGFEKRRDYFSARLDPKTFELPQKIRRVAEIVLDRGHFEVMRFRTKEELRAVAEQVGEMYNEVLASFNEGHRLSDEEIRMAIDDLVDIADPALIKILTYHGRIVGFLLPFPDLSAEIRQSNGKLGPLTILRLKRAVGRARSMIINGVGILPEYQRLGGNALLYYELTQTSREQEGRFLHAEITQVAETTDRMLADMRSLGGVVYKTHRLYERSV